MEAYEFSDGLNLKVCSKHIYHYMHVRSVHIFTFTCVCVEEYESSDGFDLKECIKHMHVNACMHIWM